jgi:hypothetical protein
MSILRVDQIQHSNGTAALTIDSSGRVLSPNKPAFQVRGSGSQSITSTGNSTVNYNTTIVDVGGNYSTVNTRFIAPVSGNYLFGSNTRLDALNMSSGADYHRLYFAVNGSASTGLYGHSIASIVTTVANYLTLSITGIISLSASDYVQVFVFSNSDISYNILPQESQFWGYLL